MSRSRKREPHKGEAREEAEKADKRLANRRLRHIMKSGELDSELREISNVWRFAKAVNLIHDEGK